MQNIYVGWDGGGTATAVVCLDAAGHLLARERFGPLNLNGASEAAVQATIADCVDFMNGIGQCAGLCVGAAGVSNPQVSQVLLRLLAKQGIQASTLLAGDHEIALSGAVGAHGAVLISGTGSICYGRDQNRTVRCGGYGHLIDDGGSGYAIGRDMLSAVLRAADGRSPQTALTHAVAQKLGSADPTVLMAYVHHPAHQKADIAAFVPLLAPAVALGDPAALAIAERAAGELCLLAQTVCAQLEIEPPGLELAMLGSVLIHCAPVAEWTAELLRASIPHLSIIVPRADAAWGAALLALNQRKGSDE
ncbi:MAG: ATPase [Clostridia bacterium]|nr:ATPase [Clostridia bacterium]